MINELPKKLLSHVVLYADDTTFMNLHNDVNTLKTLTINTMTEASYWFKTNGFSLNENKTQELTFSLKNVMSKVLSLHVV